MRSPCDETGNWVDRFLRNYTPVPSDWSSVSLHDYKTIEAVCDEDREWFENHPNASERFRQAVSGENPPMSEAPPEFTWVVRVTQLAPGVRTREFALMPTTCLNRQVADEGAL